MPMPPIPASEPVDVALSTLTRVVVESGGGEYVGIQRSYENTFGSDYACFNDPLTGTSCLIRLRDLSTDSVRAKLAEKHKLWGGTCPIS